MEQKVNAGIAVIIEDVNGRVLLGKRRGSHGAGSWSFPGGWINSNDASIDSAARREVAEETGLDLGEVELVDVMLNHFEEGRHSVTILLRAISWAGAPIAREPEKLDGEWIWFDPSSLPSPLFEPIRNSTYVRSLSAD